MEQNKNTGKNFNGDFKETVVELYHASSTVKDLRSKYCVSDVTIYT